MPAIVVLSVLHSVPCQAATYTVRPDGSGDYPTIQAAINHASAGDLIQLTDGVFTGPGNRDLDFLGRAITVQSVSGQPTACLIDCQADSADPHRGFRFHTQEGEGSILAGVTIQRAWSAGGSAVRCENNCSPTLRNCIFRENGGGSAVQQWTGVVRISQCSFVNNTASSANGAAYYLLAFPATGSITDCLFAGNATGQDGGAVAIDATIGYPFEFGVLRCRFTDNHAGGRGGAIKFDSPDRLSLTECTFDRNCAADAGGGLAAGYESSIEATRCTFSGNQSGAPGSAVAVDYSAWVDLHKCILAWSAHGLPVGCSGGSITLECCDVFGNRDGNWAGCIAGQEGENGNFSADPFLCDPMQGDLELADVSPCAPAQNPGCGQVGALGVGCTLEMVTVRSDGTGDFPTIQAAIDATAGPAMVVLEGLLFQGPGNHDIDLRGRPLHVRSASADPESCVIDCGGSPGAPHRGFLFSSGEGLATVLEGITIRGGYSAGNGGGMLCSGSSPWIRWCRIEACEAGGSGGGLHLSGASSPWVTNCVLADNAAAGAGGGIACDGSVTPAVDHCSLVENTAVEGGGIAVLGGASAGLTNTIIAFGGGGSAVACAGGEAVLGCCDLFGNAGGNWVGCIAPQAGQSGNLEVDPLFCSLGGRDLRLQNQSPCTAQHSGNCGTIGAFPVGCGSILRVHPDGTGPYPTIQAAILASIAGDIVELEDGTYRGTGNRDVSFDGHNVTVRSRSGDPAACIIDCQGTPSSRHYGFDFRSGETRAAVLEGITITNGYNGLIPGYPYPYSGCGGAVRCLALDTPYGWSNTYPIIRGCRFVGNTSELEGGAVFTWGNYPGPLIEDCWFEGNVSVGGGAVAVVQSNLSTLGCTYVDNSADEGGGLGGVDAMDCRVDGCTFVQNSGMTGGSIYASYYGYFSSLDITNTIVAFSPQGAGIYCESTTLTVTCTDIYGNVGGDWSGALTPFYGVGGNIALDPLFCGAQHPDAPWSLQADSPCAPGYQAECSLIGAWPVGCGSPAGSTGAPGLPRTLRLGRIAPSPMSGRAVLTLEVPGHARPAPELSTNGHGAVDKVLLTIHDLTGRRICTLLDQSVAPGLHHLEWDARDEEGHEVGSGVYFVRVAQGAELVSRALVVLR